MAQTGTVNSSTRPKASASSRREGGQGRVRPHLGDRSCWLGALLVDGQKVTFDVEPDRMGKGQAVNLRAS